MKNVRITIALCTIFLSFLETSSFFNWDPARFARHRFLRSRNRPSDKPISDIERSFDFIAIVNQYGYPAEEHVITTTDGYRLRIHRIPGSPSQPKAKGKPVVFLQHGLLASSDTWVLMGPSNDLAYLLADLGYDVWVGNARGNTYSRSHSSLSPDTDPEFWKFSFHEIAQLDIPAVVDNILQETNQTSLFYVGHSMGTTISYILLSTKPEYNDKFKLVINLSPVAVWHAELVNAAKFLRESANTLMNSLTRGKIYEFLPLTPFNIQLGKNLCSDGSNLQPYCVNFFFYIVGYNPKQLNTTLLPYMLTYYPAGTSSQTIFHFVQNILSEDFLMFDHGAKENLIRYGQEKPPPYPIEKITAPFALFYGKGDALVQYKDSMTIASKLRNLVTSEAVRDDLFNHADFLFARDVKAILNDRLIELIVKFTEGNSL